MGESANEVGGETQTRFRKPSCLTCLIALVAVWAVMSVAGLFVYGEAHRRLHLRVENRFRVPVTVFHVRQLAPLRDENPLITIPPRKTMLKKRAMWAHQRAFRLSVRDPAGKEVARIAQDGDRVRGGLKNNEWSLVVGPDSGH